MKYQCSNCSSDGRKLWRPYTYYGKSPAIYCLACLQNFDEFLVVNSLGQFKKNKDEWGYLSGLIQLPTPKGMYELIPAVPLFNLGFFTYYSDALTPPFSYSVSARDSFRAWKELPFYRFELPKLLGEV